MNYTESQILFKDCVGKTITKIVTDTYGEIGILFNDNTYVHLTACIYGQEWDYGWDNVDVKIKDYENKESHFPFMQSYLGIRTTKECGDSYKLYLTNIAFEKEERAKNEEYQKYLELKKKFDKT